MAHNVCMALGLLRAGLEPAPALAPTEAGSRSRAACADRSTSVTWLGHASAIIHVGDLTFLTDPVIEPDSSAASPLPPRLASPPIAVADLPRIDAILLSHGDFDHLHVPTLRALARRFPDIPVLTPVGAAKRAAARAFPGAEALRVGQSRALGAARITALPARHETRRNLAGVRDGAAVSWEIALGGRKILFVGDTGYGPAFRRFGSERGPYDILLVPIGAYEPRRYVADMHVTPEEAARIARDVKARLAIGIHWGTFALSPDKPEDARRRFLRAGDAATATRVLRIGETLAVR